MRLWAFSSSVNSFLTNKHAQSSNGAKCLIFGRPFRLLPYFMCANSEGSGETARMRRLAWAFTRRLRDKYHNLMSWLNCMKSTISVQQNLLSATFIFWPQDFVYYLEITFHQWTNYKHIKVQRQRYKIAGMWKRRLCYVCAVAIDQQWSSWTWKVWYCKKCGFYVFSKLTKNILLIRTIIRVWFETESSVFW